MRVDLKKALREDLKAIHEMQVESFMPLLKKYRDYETNPANETFEAIFQKFQQPITDYYLILHEGTAAGAIRIVRKGESRFRISPLFVLPEHQNKGIAQSVLNIVEEMYSGAKVWELETILQEEGNCHLYEKAGYIRTGKTQVVNENMTLVSYEKEIH